MSFAVSHFNFSLSGGSFIQNTSYPYELKKINDGFINVSITYWNFRMRNCSSNTYYLLSNNSCLNSCPLYNYLNTTFTYCISCYYTCYQCTDYLNNSCSACDNYTYRYLSANSCICLNGYYDIGIAQCSLCHSTCMTCSNNTNISCLTCDTSLNR